MTMHSLAALAVFLFGTTFLWLTPAFVGLAPEALSGSQWTILQILVWLTILGFSAAAWGVFKAAEWWSPALVGSAVLGLATTATYWFAVHGLDGVTNVSSNVLIHGGLSLLIVVAAAIPQVRAGIEERL